MHHAVFVRSIDVTVHVGKSCTSWRSDLPDLRQEGLTGRAAAPPKVRPMVAGFRIGAFGVDLLYSVGQSRRERIDVRMPVAPKLYILVRAGMLILHRFDTGLSQPPECRLVSAAPALPGLLVRLLVW